MPLRSGGKIRVRLLVAVEARIRPKPIERLSKSSTSPKGARRPPEDAHVLVPVEVEAGAEAHRAAVTIVVRAVGGSTFALAQPPSNR
jgi:hypothetical protein